MSNLSYACGGYHRDGKKCNGMMEFDGLKDDGRRRFKCDSCGRFDYKD